MKKLIIPIIAILLTNHSFAGESWQNDPTAYKGDFPKVIDKKVLFCVDESVPEEKAKFLKCPSATTKNFQKDFRKTKTDLHEYLERQEQRLDLNFDKEKDIF